MKRRQQFLKRESDDNCSQHLTQQIDLLRILKPLTSPRANQDTSDRRFAAIAENTSNCLFIEYEAAKEDA